MKLKLFGTIMIALMSVITLQAQDNVTELNIKGLKVLFKASNKQTISAYMFFKGGTANYNAQQQGIESLALSAAVECGTSKYNKDAFKDLADKYSIELNGSAGFDYGYITMSCVKPYFNQGWDLFTEAISHPVFEEKELALLQQKKISGLKNQESNPDQALTTLSMADAFKDTRYAIRPEGSVEAVTALKQADIKNYYEKSLNINRLLLVIVGNLSVQDVKQKVEAAFAALPSSDVKPLEPAIGTSFDKNTLNIENRKLATNYIAGIMGSPACTSDDFNAYRLGFVILHDKLFEEVRTKRNLSYAPAAILSGGLLPYAQLYVTTTKPKEAVTAMIDEVKRLRNGGFTDTDLRDAKSKLTTSYFMRNESTPANALALGIAEIKGSWKNEITLLDKINAVTLGQLQNAFVKYTGGIKWTYLGDDSLADKETFEKSIQ